jgi:TolB protein
MRQRILLTSLLLLVTGQPLWSADWITTVRDRYPTLSPDGRTLLFESDRSGRNALYISDADGKNVRLLIASDGEPENGSWSVDGKRIVYHETVGKEFDLFVINADGTGRRNVTNSPFEEAHAHWGPDGRIYFNSDRATSDRTMPWGARNHDLFRMDADGSNIVQLTDCRAVCTNPNPSRDGRMIAFRMGVRAQGLSWAQQSSLMNSEIAVLDLRTKRITNLTQHAAYDTWPSWSPDSRWVAFGSNRDGVPEVGQVYIVSVDGKTTRKLTNGPASYGEPSFSPDRRLLYFSKSIPASGSRSAFIARMEVSAD